MSDDYAEVCMTREQAHAACNRAYTHAQALLANGENVRIACGPAVEPVGIQQRRFLHGVVLRQISEQAHIGETRIRYTIDIWKTYFKNLFIPVEWDMIRVPKWDPTLGRLVQPKRPTPHRRASSTEELGQRAYARFIDDVIQHAVVELGVEFIFTNEEQALLKHKPRGKHGTDEGAADDGT